MHCQLARCNVYSCPADMFAGRDNLTPVSAFFAGHSAVSEESRMVESNYDNIDNQFSFFINKQPIVCADGLMMKCSIIDNSYIPQQMIAFEEFIASVKRAIDFLKTPDSSPVSFIVEFRIQGHISARLSLHICSLSCLKFTIV